MIASLFDRHNKLPVILQSEAAECGLACIAMVSSYFGQQFDMAALRRLSPVTSAGATLEHLIDIAQGIQLQASPVKLEIWELNLLQLPAVLHWDMKHFVVLKKVTRKKCVIHDPALGERIYEIRELDSHFTGLALQFSPGAEFTKEDHRKATRLSDLVHVSRGFYSSVVQIFLLSFVLQLANLFTPFYITITMDLGLGGQDTDLLTVIVVAFMLINLTRVVVEFVRAHAVLHFTNKIGFQMASNIYHHLIRLPMEFFERRNLNDLISQFDSVNQIKDLITRDIVGALIDGIFSLTALVALFYLSPFLTALALLSMLIFAVYRAATRAQERSRLLAVVEGKSKHQAEVMADLRSIRVIKMMCSEQKRFINWQMAYTKAANAEINSERFRLRSDVVRGAIFAIDYVVTVYVASRLLYSLELTPGQYTAFIVLKQQFTMAFAGVIPKLIDIRKLKLQLMRLSEITFAEPEFDQLSLKPFKPSLDGALRVEDVSYSYPGVGKPALHGVSFAVKPAEIVGLHGASGSGKSTLLKLLAGVINPTSGKILVDSTPLGEYGVREYRHRVAAVFHANAVMAGSILFNITLKNGDVDFEQLAEVCKLVMIHDHIQSLPMGYHSLMGDMESNLSAGQIQRVMLARALYKKPRIIFLDEAMSNLDEQMARDLLREIASLGVTILMASHSLDLLASADRVLRLVDGSITEQDISEPSNGNAEELSRVAH